MFNALLRSTDSILTITHIDHEIKGKMYALIHCHTLGPDYLSSNGQKNPPVAQGAVTDIFQNFVFADPLC